jgi:hypothetical protein
LDEAQRNTRPGVGNTKAPRNLPRVLLESRDFLVTNPRDAFYAVLGMCSVVTFTKSTELTTAQQLRYPKAKDAVLVDYSKSITEVYHDASLCILHRQRGQRNMADMWQYYKKSPLHSEGLPSWAIGWRDRLVGWSDQYISDFEIRWGLPGDDDHPGWFWPEPMELDPRVLCLKAKVLNYVAHLTDYTCRPDVFVGTQGLSDPQN